MTIKLPIAVLSTLTTIFQLCLSMFFILDLIAGNDPSVGQEGGGQIGPGYAKDSRGNVLVEFEPPYLPADGATCWLYVAQFDLWESETD